MTTLHPKTGPSSREVEPGIYQLDDGRYIRCGYDSERLQYYATRQQRPAGMRGYIETVGPNPQALASEGVETFATLEEARPPKPVRCSECGYLDSHSDDCEVRAYEMFGKTQQSAPDGY